MQELTEKQARMAQTPTATPYHYYAPFYDAAGQARFAVLVNQYLAELLERHPVTQRRALDLACGAGTLALLLADQGWDVVGVDLSEPMLAQARLKAANLITAGHVTFVRSDMRTVWADKTPDMRPASFDLVTCVYDSLNYLLTEADLAACFRTAAHALCHGGLFIADMNTRHFLEHDWGEYATTEIPGFVQITQSRFDPVTTCSVMKLTGFIGDADRGYRRFDELHIERAYPEETVAALLAEAGFIVEAAYDCFTFLPVAERTQRVAWVARKTKT